MLIDSMYEFVNYGLKNNLIEEIDAIYIFNKLQNLYNTNYNPHFSFLNEPQELDKTLNDLTFYALEKKLIKDEGCSITNFKTRLLDYLTPIPSIVQDKFFSQYKTERIPLPDKGTAVREIYDEWILTQKAYNVVDFDDLIILPIKIFEKKPEILERVQLRWRYIMVDEFQDTSLLQYRLVSMIAMKYRNIAVVGDDDQSIYSWRGANYQNIVNFEKDFPERKE